MSTTTSYLFIQYAALAVASLVVVEGTLQIRDIQPTSQLYSFGQVIPLVIAGATALRAIWVFSWMFWSYD
jgi:hypothetical protein